MVEFDTSIPVVISELETDTGFPFDDTDDDFPRTARRSRLVDDIAARHPEFADTLRAFNTDFPSTFRSNTWGRKRHPSGSCGEDDSRSQASGFSSSSNESNPSNIIESEFPEYFRSKFDSRKPPPSTRPQEKSEQEEGNKTQRNNTVDLGKKQSSLDEGSRGQRSMSAPPDNRNNQQPPQRFVSRINIDPLIPSATPQQSQQQQMGANASSAPKSPKNGPQPQPQQQQQQKQPNVRHIPIFVEGRDEPVLPKNIHPEPPTQEKRYFGEDPSTFTKFLNKGGQPQKTQPVFTAHHEFIPKSQQPSYQQQQPSYQQQQPSYQQQQPSYQQQQPSYHQQQPHHFQQQPSFQQQPQQPSFEQQQQSYQKQQQQNQRQQTPPPKPGPLDPIGKIQLIQKDVLELMTQVENFKGASRKDKQYLYLDEMLTRNLLKLDNIETEGKENIRVARKEAIKCIEKCISILEAKADSAAAAAAANPENVNQQVEETQQTMEVEPVATTEEQILAAGVTGTEPIDNKQLSKNLMEAEKKQELVNQPATEQVSTPLTDELQTVNKQEEQKTEIKQETTETPEKMETEPVIPVIEGVSKTVGDTNENSKTESDTNKATKAEQKSVEKSPKKKGKSKGIKKDQKNEENKMDVEVTENKNDNKMEVEEPSSNQGNKPVEDASQKPKAAKPVEETKNIT